MNILKITKTIFSAATILAIVGSIQWAGGSEMGWGGLPAGKGRAETFGHCIACHSTKLIIQQGMTRDQWDETLVWMVEEQAMQEPPPELRELILDYLAAQFPPHRPHYQKNVQQ